MGLLLDHLRLSLLHLYALLLIQDQLLVLLLLDRDEQLLLINLAVERESGPLVDLHHAIVLVPIPVEAERGEGVG